MIFAKRSKGEVIKILTNTYPIMGYSGVCFLKATSWGIDIKKQVEFRGNTTIYGIWRKKGKNINDFERK
jgi:hypothetical protein